jgi:hypothetical protein
MGFSGIHDEVSNSITHLHTNLDPQNYDMSGMGSGDDVILGDMLEREVVTKLPIFRSSVLQLSLMDFQIKLVEHFNIQHQAHELIGPAKNK